MNDQPDNPPDRRRQVSVRSAVKEDASLLFGFIRELAEYEELAHEVMGTEMTLADQLFSARPVAQAVVGEVDTEPAGFALFFMTFSTFLCRPGIWVEDLYVRPAHRGRGVGRALLGHVARVAVQLECGRLEWAALDWNEPALRFYRDLGAQPMDQWTTQRLEGDALDRLARTR